MSIMKQRFLLIPFLVTLLVMGLGCAGEDYAALMRKAQASLDKGAFSTALLQVNKAIEEKKTPEALKLKGNIYLLGYADFAEAKKWYHEALKLNPKYINAIHNIGLANLKEFESVYEKTGKKKKVKKQLTEARAWFEKALAINPHFQLSREEMGKVLYYEGKVKEAIKHVKTILDESPDNFRMLLLLGEIYLLGKKSPKKALSYLNRALEVDSRVADVYWFRYLAYKKLKKKKRAKNEYSLYIEALKNTGLPKDIIEKVSQKKERYIP